MKRKTFSLKSILSLFLTLLLLVYPTPSALADAADDLGTNSQSAGGLSLLYAGGDESLMHKYMAYPHNWGYRISVVDLEGNRVTNSVDIVNYRPEDLENQSLVLGDVSTNADRLAMINGYAAYKNYIGPKTMGGGKVDNFYYSNGIKTEEYKDRTFAQGMGVGVPSASNKYGTIETNMYPRAIAESLIELAATDFYSKNPDFTPRAADAFNIPAPHDISGKNITAGGGKLKAVLETRMDANNSTESPIAATVLLQASGPLYDNKGDDKGERGKIFRLLPNAPGADKMGSDIGDGKTYNIITAMKEYKYKAIVEPLYWYVPEVYYVNESKAGTMDYVTAPYYVEGVVYGTASYILAYTYNKLLEKGVTAERAKHMFAGTNWGTSSLGITTMMTDHTDTDLGVREPTEGGLTVCLYESQTGTNYWSLYSTAAGDHYKTVGYSCFIYDSEALFGDPEGTHTWDSNTYPEESYEPGPAPEVPTEEQGTGKSKQNIIVKYYAHKTDSGYTYINNFNRDNTISPIDIEDEPKFKVDGWFGPIVPIVPSQEASARSGGRQRIGLKSARPSCRIAMIAAMHRRLIKEGRTS